MPRKLLPAEKAEACLWLARNPTSDSDTSGWYVIALDAAPSLIEIFPGCDEWHNASFHYPPDIYNQLVSGIRLRPGEGPTKIMLTILETS